MSNPPLRVAVLADMLEERWPSMDLVADVLVRPAPLANRLSEEELAAHAALVAKLGAKGIWSKYSPSE